MPLRNCCTHLGLAAVLLAVAPPPCPAQGAADTDSSATRATLLRGGELGELLAVYMPRNETEVQRLLGDSRDMEGALAGDLERTRKLALDADGRARIMKQELEVTRARRDVARRAGDAPAAAGLEAEFQRQDRERAYLENLRDALRADAERLTAEREAVALRTAALDKELGVVQRYRIMTTPRTTGPHASATPAATGGAAAPTPEALALYRRQLRDMLEAQRVAADRFVRVAERRRQLAELKIRQMDALTRLTAPPPARR